MRLSALIAAMLATLTAPRAQGTFGNLDFESAQVPDLPFGQFQYEPANLAIPDWNAIVGSDQLSTIGHNGGGLGSAGVSIYGPSGWENVVFHGFYAVELFAGIGPENTYVGASISQTGLIPANAKSLLFFGTENLQVSFNGEILSTFPVHTGNSVYTQYGADISSLAGQTGELQFYVGPGFQSPSSSAFLDTILFSTQAVPEPSAIGLGGLGALVVGLGLKSGRPKA